MHYSYSNYAPHYRALLSLGIPLVVGQIGTIILGFADTLMIGRNKAYDLVKSGQVKALRLGNHYRIPRDAFLKFLKGESVSA